MADDTVKTKKWPQILTTLVVNLGVISSGASMAWPAPVYGPLLLGTTPIKKALSTKELDWVGSLLALGACVGAVIAGTLAGRFGKKNTLLFASMPFIFSFLVIATTTNDIQLYFCRFLMGIGVGICFSIFPIYVAEISEDSIRGLTTSTMQLFLCVGMMVPYGIGPFVSFTMLAIVSLLIPTAFFLLFMLFPESPYSLISINQKDAAIKSIQFFKGIKKENIDVAEKEVEMITAYLNQSSGGPSTISDLCNTKANKKANIIALSLVFFQQMSGINAIGIYVTKIFAASKSTLDPSIQTIIVGVVQILSSLITPPIIDRLGRKIILLISAVGMAASESLIGVYFILMDNGMNIDKITFLPIVGMMGYVFFFCTGYGPVPWTIVGEIFNDNIRARGATLTAAFAWMIAFLQMQLFSTMENTIGFGGILLLYCACDVLSVVFVIFVVKETKGKSLKEIQEMLEK